jgi:uncharacterized LabA/DUF88 family protein
MKNDTITIKFHSDAGHGWGAVKKQVIIDLGLATEISSYSYINGKTIYLEEDHDLPLVVRALNAKGIHAPIQKMKHHDRSPIRSYDYYDPYTAGV